MEPRQNGRRCAVAVQDRAEVCEAAVQGGVEQGFRRGLAVAKRGAFEVDGNKVGGAELAFVFT